MAAVDRNRGLVVLLALSLLGALITFAPPPVLIWNATPSFSKGLYYLDRDTHQYQRGDLVYFGEPSESLARARYRSYLPSRGLFMKRIAGFPGDEICLDEEDKRLLINDVPHGKVFDVDGLGRQLTPTYGCYLVPPGHFFPYSPYERSYDGRYFGAVSITAIQGRLTPLYLVEEK